MPALRQDMETAHHLDHEFALEVGQFSSAGRKPVNEDAIGIRIPDGSLLTTKGAAMVIADGVSAAEAGREASQASVTSFLSDYFSTPESWSVKNSAAKVMTALNRWLYSRGQCFTDSTRGYVTTFSALVLKSQQAHIFHVGDSRVYRFRDGVLQQVTIDHSTPVTENHSYLARALGLDVRVDVDYRSLDLKKEDCFLLTTDGIHDSLSSAELTALLDIQTKDLSATCQAITAAAFQAGSTDNLSCQLVKVNQLPDPNVDDVVNRLTRLRFPPLLETGDCVDGYRILDEIHSSPRSQVYLVEDQETGHKLCMKTPSVNFEDDAAYIERFVMEAWIGSRVTSPHIIKVVEPTIPRSYLYYLTEYVSGTTLSQWMHEHPRPGVEESVYLIDQIAKGIRAFHRRETLHQDIKPDNILIDSEGQVRIIDFGSCLVAGISEITTPLGRDAALGTVTYAAPEYSLGAIPGYHSDLFSLAVISYQMLTGKLPFQGKLENCRNSRDFLATKYTESYRINPLVPQWIDGALKKALRFEPERRHADVMEFAYELKEPNQRYLRYEQRPLMERDPLKAWKVLATVLALTQAATLIFWLK